MSRSHAFVIAIALGVAAIVGATAALRTAQLGGPAAASPPPAASLTARARALDRQEAALRRALAKRPPKLPPVPSVPIPSPHPAAVPAVVQSAPAASFGDDHSGSDGGFDDHSGHGSGGDDD